MTRPLTIGRVHPASSVPLLDCLKAIDSARETIFAEPTPTARYTLAMNRLYAIRQRLALEYDTTWSRMAEVVNAALAELHEVAGVRPVQCPQCGHNLDASFHDAEDKGHCAKCEQRGQ